MLKSPNKKKKMSEVDRISGLPETVLHRILSFLDMKDVLLTSLLSRTWRYLWVTLPYLNFDISMWGDDSVIEKMEKKNGDSFGENFIEFVATVMLLRNECDIQKFSLTCGSHYIPSRLKTWIMAAVIRSVQELHLEIHADQLLELPPYPFSSTSLRVFTLRNTLGSSSLVQLPNLMCSAIHLKTLQLLRVKIPEGDSNGELLLTCPSLEDLIIEYCDLQHLNVLNISAFQLKNLSLEFYVWDYVSSCKIMICTPNLLSFKYHGCIYDCSLENLSSLVNANISSSSHLCENLNAQSLMNVLKGLYNVKTLILSAWQLQTCSKFSNMLKGLPKAFDNLRYLKLTGWCNGSCIGAIGELLKSSPYIETLVLEIETDINSTNKGGDWGAQLSFDCLFYNLKSVEMKNPEGCENELKFLEFLLKNAVMLEDITITSSKKLSQDKESELVEFSNKLQLLPRVSSSVTISFL